MRGVAEEEVIERHDVVGLAVRIAEVTADEPSATSNKDPFLCHSCFIVAFSVSMKGFFSADSIV